MSSKIPQWDGKGSWKVYFDLKERKKVRMEGGNG